MGKRQRLEGHLMLFACYRPVKRHSLNSSSRFKLKPTVQLKRISLIFAFLADRNMSDEAGSFREQFPSRRPGPLSPQANVLYIQTSCTYGAIKIKKTILLLLFQLRQLNVFWTIRWQRWKLVVCEHVTFTLLCPTNLFGHLTVTRVSYQTNLSVTPQ